MLEIKNEKQQVSFAVKRDFGFRLVLHQGGYDPSSPPCHDHRAGLFAQQLKENRVPLDFSNAFFESLAVHFEMIESARKDTTFAQLQPGFLEVFEKGVYTPEDLLEIMKDFFRRIYPTLEAGGHAVSHYETHIRLHLLEIFREIHQVVFRPLSGPCRAILRQAVYPLLNSYCISFEPLSIFVNDGIHRCPPFFGVSGLQMWPWVPRQMIQPSNACRMTGERYTTLSGTLQC
jgi:hypothetical protein